MSTASQHESFLRRLAMNDEATLRLLLGTSVSEVDCVETDAKTVALVRLAAIAALESHTSTYQWGVGAALAAGATDDGIVDVLVAIAPVIGAARVAAAAPALAGALGYDTEASGEEPVSTPLARLRALK